MSRSDIDAIFAAAPKKKIKTSSPTPKRQRRRREKKRTEAGDDDRFKDSRGTVPRRKTADGYTIYKEDELGISTTGGDTPLCPFDCQCCF